MKPHLVLNDEEKQQRFDLEYVVRDDFCNSVCDGGVLGDGVGYGVSGSDGDDSDGVGYGVSDSDGNDSDVGGQV